jgi:hypothetical protein
MGGVNESTRVLNAITELVHTTKQPRDAMIGMAAALAVFLLDRVALDQREQALEMFNYQVRAMLKDCGKRDLH